MGTHTFDLSAGHLALDFANTVDGSRQRRKTQPDAAAEHLCDYGDVLDWAAQAGALADAERRRLARAAAARPSQAASVHRRAIALREAIFSAFDARWHGRPEPGDALATVDREARVAGTHRALRRQDGGVALVIGANDVTNPAARTDTGSPIYGMPILNVDQAKNVIVIKRSMKPGFAGIDNDLYLDPKTGMLFGDAKAAVERVITELKKAA